MRVTLVDERDAYWEDAHPVFRVFFFESPNARVSVYDIRESDLVDTISWAEERTTMGSGYSIALHGTDRDGRMGLYWLVGTDERDSHGRPTGLR